QGVLLTGLGTFAVVQERFHGVETVYVGRRPVFQLDQDTLCLQEFTFPSVLIPGDVETEPLNYRQLSRVTSFPQHVVEACVQETILLYCLQLRSGRCLPFAFRAVGVLCCSDGALCMRFYPSCVAALE
ncbi:Coiled-coil domain-containing protein 81, partial [Nestor notabilis]